MVSAQDSGFHDRDYAVVPGQPVFFLLMFRVYFLLAWKQHGNQGIENDSFFNCTPGFWSHD
jgi:hypothetical protein